MTPLVAMSTIVDQLVAFQGQYAPAPRPECDTSGERRCPSRSVRPKSSEGSESASSALSDDGPVMPTAAWRRGFAIVLKEGLPCSVATQSASLSEG